MVPRKFGFFMCCLSVIFYLGHPLLIDVAHADSSDGGIVPENPGGDNNACGPCNDPHNYTSSGVGNGICGRCGDKTYTYEGGSCQGTDNVDEFNCLDTSYYTTYTANYESTPVGSLMFAVCLAALAACVIADGACFTLCGGVCFVSGVFTLGASCLACLGACGAGGVACICAYDECKENCDYVPPMTHGTGTTAGCW